MRARDEWCAAQVGAAQQVPWWIRAPGMWVAGLLLIVLVFACLDRSVEVAGSSTTITVLGILITPTVATLAPGDHVQFQAKGVTSGGDSVASPGERTEKQIRCPERMRTRWRRVRGPRRE